MDVIFTFISCSHDLQLHDEKQSSYSFSFLITAVFMSLRKLKRETSACTYGSTVLATEIRPPISVLECSTDSSDSLGFVVYKARAGFLECERTEQGLAFFSFFSKTAMLPNECGKWWRGPAAQPTMVVSTSAQTKQL